MMRKLCLTAAALVLTFGSVKAGWVTLNKSAVPNTPPSVTLLRDDYGSTVFRIDISGFELREVVSNAKTYASVDLLTDVVTTRSGYPEVPYFAAILAIPDNAGLSVELIDAAPPQTFRGLLLPPSRPGWKEGDPEPRYQEDAEAYSSPAMYPENDAALDPPVIFRDFRIARVAVFPVRYVADRNELQVVPSMTVRVRYDGGHTVNPKSTPRRPIAPSFAAIYRNSILNYQSVLNRDHNGLESGRDVMLCIMPDSFVTKFQTYAQWRHKTGTFVKITKFTDIGANASNPDIIKNHIADAYHNWQYPPTHVLLVGDYGWVPIKIITSGGYSLANEDYFVEIDGNDHFPEMMIGRLTNQNNYRLEVMTTKFMNYERTPYTTNPDWFKKGICCSNRAYESQRETKRLVAGVMLQDGGFISVDTLMSDSPCTMNLTTVINTINAGRSFLNYRGEGWSTGWWAECYNFPTSSVSSVNNGQMLTFVTSIGCGVAMFNASGGNCFGEEWLELGTPTSPRGAVAFVGPTSNTHTTYNNRIDKGIYVGMFREGMDSPGQALLRGKLYMYNVFGTDPWVEYHYRVFTVLGDPSIHIWKDLPRAVTVTHPSTLPIGYSQSTFVVVHSSTGLPVQNAQVCASLDTTFVTGCTDAVGRVTLGLTREALGTLAVAVRGGNVIPYEGSIVMVQATVHVAPFGAPAVVDLDGNLDGRINPNENCQIRFTLKNWGTQTADNVQASLSLQDTTYVRMVVAGPNGYGTLGSGGSAAGSAFQFFVKPTCPVGYNISFNLHVTSNTSSWDYIFGEPVKGCNLTYKESSIDDEHSHLRNGRMDPGETVQLFVTISNTGEDAAPNVVGILRSSDGFITVNDSLGSFGTLQIGAMAANTADPFVVTVAPSCSLRHVASYSLELSTQSGFYPYSITRAFTIPVGQPAPFDPMGPDSYGYYAYASDDTFYQQAPVYNWFEISSLGTFIPRNSSGDFTQTVNLPFTFKYYGQNYTQVRVSSDGWIAFGSGTQTVYTNRSLPYNDAVNCMVAAFWDDLYSTNALDSSKLYYYSDAANHRFIAEWSRVSHYSNYQDRETFQIVLLDPAYYPTPTGDGEITMQYQTVDEPSSNTVGIEDHTQTVGLQYVYNDSYAETATRLRDGHAIKFTTKQPTLLPRMVTIGVSINPGWNMISNPVKRTGQNGVRQLYPNAVFDYAYTFQPGQGYFQSMTMANGVGYWEKFPASETNVITGEIRSADTVDIATGWNAIGSISTSVEASRVSTIPSGLRASAFFSFANGYSSADHIVPGKGYWVKSNGSGKLVLSAWAVDELCVPFSHTLALVQSLNSLRITDAAGNSQTLYFGREGTDRMATSAFEMPPLPPADAFDARFESVEGGLMVALLPVVSASPVELPIRLQSAAYPVTVAWDILDAVKYELADGATGELLCEGSLESRDSVRVEDNSIGRLLLRVPGGTGVPNEFALWQNFPNPFNPSTTIRFALPVESLLTIEIFNLLGQCVRNLTAGKREAGYHTVVWDGSTDAGLSLGSGVYLLHLKANGADGRSFSSVQKLLLLK